LDRNNSLPYFSLALSPPFLDARNVSLLFLAQEKEQKNIGCKLFAENSALRLAKL
jgi:hypothetical protein